MKSCHRNLQLLRVLAASGQLSAGRLETLRDHARFCPLCRQALRQSASLDAALFLAAATRRGSSPPFPERASQQSTARFIARANREGIPLQPQRPSWSLPGAFALPLAAVVLLALVWLLSTTGSPLPATFPPTSRLAAQAPAPPSSDHAKFAAAQPAPLDVRLLRHPAPRRLSHPSHVAALPISTLPASGHPRRWEPFLNGVIAQWLHAGASSSTADALSSSAASRTFLAIPPLLSVPSNTLSPKPAPGAPCRDKAPVWMGDSPGPSQASAFCFNPPLALMAQAKFPAPIAPYRDRPDDARPVPIFQFPATR